jgi:hypothetical protein
LNGIFNSVPVTIIQVGKYWKWVENPEVIIFKMMSENMEIAKQVNILKMICDASSNCEKQDF